MRALLCLALLTAPALGQEAADAPRTSLSFGEIQEMFDRFSDSTMRSIEDQLRTKLDDYEEALEKSRQDDVAQPDSPVTYRLTFTMSGASAPMSILTTLGKYSLEAEQGEEERADSSGTTKVDGAILHCEGIVEPGFEGGVRVEFEGMSQLRRTETASGSTRQDSASIAFSGSANVPLGQDQEIASNDELRIVLRVDEVRGTIPAERPAAR